MWDNERKLHELLDPPSFLSCCLPLHFTYYQLLLQLQKINFTVKTAPSPDAARQNFTLLLLPGLQWALWLKCIEFNKWVSMVKASFHHARQARNCPSVCSKSEYWIWTQHSCTVPCEVLHLRVWNFSHTVISIVLLLHLLLFILFWVSTAAEREQQACCCRQLLWPKLCCFVSPFSFNFFFFFSEGALCCTNYFTNPWISANNIISPFHLL